MATEMAAEEQQSSVADQLEESARVEAADAAVEMLRGAPEDEERLRSLAHRIAREGPADLAENAVHAQAVMMSLGLPVARILLAELAELSAAPAATKREYRAKAANLSEITETGSICIEIKTQANVMKAHIVLAECPPDYDLGRELDKIYRLVPEGKKADVLQHVTALVNAGRMVFGRVVVAHAKFVQEVAESVPGFAASRFRLQLDPANTTFSLPAPCVKKVGVHVRT